MVFVTEKIKQTNKFNLDGLEAKRVVKKAPGLSPWQKFFIALISGSILALASPGFDQWWLAWFMLAPFLVLLAFCHRNIEPLLVGLAFGFAYHLISLHYYFSMTDSSRQVSMIVWLIQAFMLSLPTVGFAWLISFLPLRPGYIPYFQRPFFSYLIGVPLLWVFLHWGLSITYPLTNVWKFAPFPPLPTDSLIYSQYSLLPMLQVLKYIGPSGLEFLLLLVNSAIAACIIEFIKTKEGPVERVDAISPRAGSLLDLFGALVLIGALYYFGKANITNSIKQSKEFLEYDKSNERTQPILEVGIITGGQMPTKSDTLSIEKQLAIVVFPEANNEINLAQTNNVLNASKNNSGQYHNVRLLSFASSEQKNITRNNFILTPKNSINIKQSIYYAAGLVMINDMLTNNATNGQKPMLLLSSLPTFLQEWLFRLGKDDSLSWYSLNMPKINWGKIGLLSGPDITDFRLVTSEVRRGASLIVSSANLSWMRNCFLNKQLLAAAIFRAIENNRYVILCTNGGVMAIVEPNGAVQSLSLPSPATNQKNGDSNLLLGTVQFLWSKTPLTKTWWL